ncbi:nucleoside monophosphate kinase [Patescibacteria group bacterium]|nr:nucleoside monophosphate kinase [Patescibacteria group bacterium]
MKDIKQPKHLIFLGPPGSGKGTQAKMILEKWPMNHLSTGDLIRDYIKKGEQGDEVGLQMKELYDKGVPQPDGLIIKAVREYLKTLDLSKGMIFDSFPLSEQQAYGLDDIRQDFSMEEPIVLFVKISEAESVNRLSLRKYCPQCNSVFGPQSANYQSGQCDKCQARLITRSDDNPEVVGKRYQEYIGRMEALKKYYQPRLRWLEINGEQSVADVQQEILTKLQEFHQNRG